MPVLVSGSAEGADALVVQRLGSGRMAIALARWDGAWTVGTASPPLPEDALVGGTLRVVLDRRAQLVVASLEGREIFRHRVELQPLRPDALFIGRTPRRKPRGKRDVDDPVGD